MTTLLEKYGVVHRVATTYHSQTSEQVEVFNREIKQILQKIAHPNRKDRRCSLGSSDNLLNIVRNVPLSNKVKRCNLAFDQAGKERKLQLQELEELPLGAYENSKFYKEKVKRFHDNMTLRKEFKLIVGRLRSKWDRLVITNIFPYDIVEIRDEATNKIFKVNGHQLKPFHESPTMMEDDVEDLSLVKPTLPELIASLKVKNYDHPILRGQRSFRIVLGMSYLEIQMAKLDNLNNFGKLRQRHLTSICCAQLSLTIFRVKSSRELRLSYLINSSIIVQWLVV
ncbi:hypothetical protein CR513_51158, partial [Mucuna pruriens]